MKRVLFVCLSIVAIATGASAQIAKPVSEDAKSPEKTIKNAPFTAEAVTESVQILWDGTKIVRKTVSKLYRDNDGRFRREDSKTLLGVPGDRVEIAESIRIVDPVSGMRYELDVEDRTFKQISLKPRFELKKEFKFDSVKQKEWNIKQEANVEIQAENKARQNEKQAEQREKQEKNREKQEENRAKQEERRNKQAEERAAEKTGTGPDVRVSEPKPSPDGQTIGKNGIKTKNESLGVQTVQGVIAEGTRTTTTIPTGTIGNDRDINVVYEKWYSKELQMTVLSKHTDPRFGEQTYQLSNISRDNPPIDLFTPPDGYKNDDDKDGRVKLPRVPSAPSAPRVTIKPPAPPAGKAEPKKPAV